MNLAVLAFPICAVAVFGLVVLIDRVRERFRDPRRPCVLVDRRTYRDASRQVEKLTTLGDFDRAWAACIAICQWLGHERHFGSARRQAWMSSELANWTARRAEFKPAAPPWLTTGRGGEHAG